MIPEWAVPFIEQFDTMARFTLHKMFVVTEYEDTTFKFPPHSHDHFEIIIVKEGTGTHIINDASIPYKRDDVFFLAPNDYHCFEIEEKSSFLYLKFTDQLLSLAEKSQWSKEIISALYTPNLIPGEMGLCEQDKKKILEMSDIILEEYHQQYNYSLRIIYGMLHVMLCIIARSVLGLYVARHLEVGGGNHIVEDIMSYIRMHILDQSKMNIETIASSMNLSCSYVRRVFREQTGKPLMQCVWDYRTLMAENLLVQTKLTVSEIAVKLGFSDQSHLIRRFRQKFGIAPGEYRKIEQKSSSDDIFRDGVGVCCDDPLKEGA